MRAREEQEKQEKQEQQELKAHLSWCLLAGPVVPSAGGP